jgi:integrase
MNIKDYIKKKVNNINSNHQYKLRFYSQKNDLLSIHAVFRKQNVYDKKALNLALENRTTQEAKFKDLETLRVAENKLKLLDEKMEKKLSGKLDDRNFLEFFRLCIDKPTKEGKIRTDGTKKNWRRVLKHLKTFIKQTYRKDDISFDLVNYPFFSTLHSWFVNNFKQYSANSMWSIIKKFVKYAVLEERINDANLLLKIQSELIIKRPKIERTEKDYLTLDEIQQMMKFPYYPRYKLPFIFNCYVGLRISDLKKLIWNNFNKDFTEISIIEKKTGKSYQAPVHSFVTDLLNRLYDKKNSDSNLIFDLPIDDWKTNKHLKKWAKLSGIEKKMSSHIMRRTFLNLMEWSGIPLTSSSKLLNHSSVKITEQYYLANDKNLLKKELEKLPSLSIEQINI